MIGSSPTSPAILINKDGCMIKIYNDKTNTIDHVFKSNKDFNTNETIVIYKDNNMYSYRITYKINHCYIIDNQLDEYDCILYCWPI